MTIDAGEILHIIERRAFEGDVRRHFVGKVEKVGNISFRIKGYPFVYNAAKNEFIRKRNLRTRIVSISDAKYIINVLPANADIESTVYKIIDTNRLVVTDGKTFELDVNEFSVNR